jgi:hypothetical protein
MELYPMVARGVGRWTSTGGFFRAAGRANPDCGEFAGGKN